tara:strand:- start:249 stop:1394 length:1146 start_codon:yes stop_codon:yes gene_type:complete
MTTKKGILVRTGASTDVHKLDDSGEFNLGLAGTAPTISLNAVTSVEGLASDVKTMITDIDTARSTEETADTTTLADIQTKLDNLQIQMGTAGDGEATWSVNTIATPTSFKDADGKLDTKAKDIQDRLVAIMGHSAAHSFTNQISDVVFTDPSGDGTRLGTGGTLLTIEQLSASISSENGTISSANPVGINAATIAFITQQKNTLVNAASASYGTLLELKTEVEEEVTRQNAKDLAMDGKFATSMTNSSLNAVGTANFGYGASSYIAAAATLKAADEALDTAVKARETKMDDWETHLNLTGDITATGAVSLSEVSFALDSGRFTMPNMSAGAAETAFATGNHDGKFVYINGAGGGAGSTFEQGNKLYMCEDGVWFASSFKYE